MATLTRDELITLSENMADAVDGGRWSSTLKLQLLGRVHRAECRKILNANRWYWFQEIEVTTDADGVFSLDDLTTGSGDALKQWYRILSVATGETSSTGRFYLQETTYEQYPTPANGGWIPNSWYRKGNDIQVAPSLASSPIVVGVNYLPQRADLLSAGNVEVPYVADYELILAYETAAQMLMKGAAESGSAGDLLSLANSMRNDMMQDLRRTGTRPQRPQPMDDPAQWGG